MMKLSDIRLMQRIAAMTGRLRDDCRGLAAVEFALIVPLMLTIVFGTIEITNGVAVDRKVDLVSRTLSDLTSRASAVSSTDLNSFFTIGSAIMQTYPSAPLLSTITQVYIDPATGNGKAQWSQGSNARATNTAVTVPIGLVAKDTSGNVVPNQYLILSEVSYNYTPAVGYVIRSGVNLSASNFTRPRQSNSVTYTP